MDDERAPVSEAYDEDPVEAAPELDEPIETLSLKDSFGTAVGAAMLGFEQALRREPPAEVLAAEHMPERGHSGEDAGDLVIEIPEPVERREP